MLIRLTLLGQHNSSGGECRALQSGYREELDQSREEVVASNNLIFKLKLDMNIVEIACRLKLAVTEAAQRCKSFRVTLLSHKPSGRLWHEVDEHKGQGWNESGS